MNPQTWWYVARATGLVAWVLFTCSVVWGLALSTRILERRPKAGWILDLHRYLGGLAVLYTAFHLASLVADSYVSFDITDLFVPLASEWRPVAVAWGIAALFGLLAVELTSLTKRYVGRRMWRVVHMLSLLGYALADLHAFTAGTDTGGRAARWFAIASGALIVFLLAYRQLTKWLPAPRPPADAPAGARLAVSRAGG